ncbi:hypothetical protein BGX26_000827 [Mortierella sp. AD094]|nr:hypothetical protein BGX26_000827 [Mortierella sp. AD094]
MKSHPLSLFFLPTDLVSTLVHHSPSDTTIDTETLPSTEISDTTSDTLPLIETPALHPSDSITAAIAGQTQLSTPRPSMRPSCRICNISQFESVQRQREHVKSDWHLFNLKYQLSDKEAKPISELQFNTMLLSLPSPLTTEDKSFTTNERSPSRIAAVISSDTTQNFHGQIQCLIKNLKSLGEQNVKSQKSSPILVRRDILKQQAQEARMSPMVWFSSSLYGPSTLLGVFKNALPNRGQCDDPVDYLKSLQFPLPPLPPKKVKVRRSVREKARALEQQAQPTNRIELGGQSNETQRENVAVSSLTVVESSKSETNSKENIATDISPKRYWTLILLGGGHFAGMVVDLAGQSSKAHHARDLKIVIHKTFRRYTVRKKQGGAQSSQGGANSAGARVRMYNERALKLEVRELLEGWAHWIEQSECVFVHAPGNNRRTLYYDGAVIPAADHDGRLRSIPFVTRRPTLAELKRAYSELTTVKVTSRPEDALEKARRIEQEVSDMHPKDSELSKSSSPSSPSIPNLSLCPGQNEPISPLYISSDFRKLVQLIKKGRTSAVTNHLVRSAINPSGLLPVSADSEYDRRKTPTILHLAAQHGQSQIVQQLLEVHGVDPTMTVASFIRRTDIDPDLISDDLIDFAIQSKPKTAYEIAKDKETRNAFRRAMAKMPDAWDWIGLARVPSPLTPEMEVKQQRPHEEKQASNMSKSLGAQAELLPPKLVPTPDSAEAADSSLRWEQRLTADREKRARAAEARILAFRQATSGCPSRPSNNLCLGCSTDLGALSPSEKFSHHLCGESSLSKTASRNI